MAGGQSKKSKKYGRNAVWCKVYRLTNRREKNKIKKLQKRLLRFPEDASALTAMERCKATIRGVATA